MSDLAFSNSSNLYHSFGIRSRILEEGKSCELRYAAEVDGRIFDIQLEVSDEMLKNQEKIKQAVINKALLASKLIPPTNRDLFTKVDSPGRIDKDILYFRAEALCTHESLDKIRKIFQIKLADQETQQDITALLEKLPCHEMTESEVVHCLEALQTIKDSFKRQQIIQKIDPSKINKSWFSVLPFAIRANEVDKNPDRIDLTAWEPILDWTVNGNSGFFEALKQGNLDINTKDRSENNLFIAAMKHIRKREYLEFAKKLLLIPGCKPVDFWILSLIEHPLILAIRTQDPEFVTNLMNKVNHSERGFRSSRRGYTILAEACMQPNPRILQQVLTLPEIDINEKDKQDKTALYYAILNGNVENAAILLGLPEIEKSLNDAELLICAAEKAESGNLEIIQGILAHPLLDKSLMETCLDRLELAVFPENLLETFAKHFPAKIAHASNSLYFKIPRLLNSRNTKEAQEALEAMYQKDNALEISSLLPLDINIFKFILQDNYSSYSKWLTTSQTLKELPLERQFFLCDRLEPRLFCKYLTKGIYGWVIGPMGIKALIDYLRRKAPPSLTLENSISVCHDYEDFSNQLKDLSANPNLPDGYCHYFIVAGIKKNPEEIANHVTPLFFKKEAGQWSVIITDSTTDLNNTNKYCNPLTKIILDAEETSSKNFSIKKIYINTFWRQHDATNCPVFAIRDTVNFYKKGDSFLKELSSKYQDKHTKTEWINQYDLPPDWMKSTQSIKEIEKYIGLSEKRKSLIMHTKKTQNQEETLSENLARHKKVDENHQMRNFLILQRAIKYSGIVLSYFLREMAHRPLKNPWNSLESKP